MALNTAAAGSGGGAAGWMGMMMMGSASFVGNNTTSSSEADASVIALVNYLRSEADLSDQKAASLRLQADALAASCNISQDEIQHYGAYVCIVVYIILPFLCGSNHYYAHNNTVSLFPFLSDLSG